MVPRQWQSGGCQKRARGQEKSEGARITREKTRRTGNDALVVKRHVFLIDDQATDTLLTVPRRELVSEFGPPSLSDEHFNERLVVFGVRDHDFVDVARDWRLVCHGGVFVRDARRLASERVVIRVRRRLLVDIHIAWVNTLADACQTIRLDDVVLLLQLSVVVQGCIC